MEDGTPVTADDEVFHYQVDTIPDILSADKSLIAGTARFEALDAGTAKWTGIPGYVDSNYFLDVWSPLPRHAYGKLQMSGMAQDETINRKPLAFGPFKVDEWVAGDHITLSRTLITGGGGRAAQAGQADLPLCGRHQPADCGIGFGRVRRGHTRLALRGLAAAPQAVRGPEADDDRGGARPFI